MLISLEGNNVFFSCATFYFPFRGCSKPRGLTLPAGRVHAQVAASFCYPWLKTKKQGSQHSLRQETCLHIQHLNPADTGAASPPGFPPEVVPQHTEAFLWRGDFFGTRYPAPLRLFLWVWTIWSSYDAFCYNRFHFLNRDVPFTGQFFKDSFLIFYINHLHK
ncbi:MAG: hypothetical protein J1E60_00425 [Christensenellaceae bacterium]|nr:hypothetical protein [Christensenellaceae bacterium]